ncbi:transcriptional regulator [Streptomyces sp. PKU-MA01144]|nr:transcriptional regulator [Streptomyces sp. PKU-MA01144]
MKGDARTTVARRAADLYEQGSTIKGVAQEISRSYGNTRTLLLEAGVTLRARGGRIPRTGR